MALFFALLSHIGWGVGDVFGVVATRRMGTIPMTVWRGIFAFILATMLLLPFFWKDFLLVTPQLGVIILGLSILSLIADFAFFESLRVGNPPVVGVISASFVAVAVLISILFLGEHLTPEKAAIVLTILIGIGLCVFDHRIFSFAWTRGELMAVIAMIGWGLYYALIKIPVQAVGWFVPGYLFLALFPIIGLALRLKKCALPSPFRGGVFYFPRKCNPDVDCRVVIQHCN